MHNAIHMQAQCLARPVVPSKMLYSAPPSTRAFHRRIAGSQTARSRRTSSLVVHARMPRWDQMYPVLINKSLRSISPEEAQALQQNGAVLVDVRRGDIYGQGHVAGAVSIPMFQNLDWEKPSAGKVLKFIACAANGVTPVEINPDFVAKVGALGAKTVVLMCEAGGTMEPSVNFKFGKESQSLKAAFVAIDGQVPCEVLHLNGGVYGWYNAGLPMEGEYDGRNAARTPQIAAKPSGFYIDGEGAEKEALPNGVKKGE